MIKNIIFDFGGVILKHKATLIEDILVVMFPDSSSKALEVWKKYDSLLKIGKKTSDDFMSELKNATGTTRTLDELKKQWMEEYIKRADDVNWELLDYVGKLKKKYNTYLFTDTIDIHDEYNRQKTEIFTKFNKVYRSIEEGVAKVEGKGVFVYLLRKINAKLEECLVVDDVEKYVTMAQELGMKGILYKNNEELKQELSKIL